MKQERARPYLRFDNYKIRVTNWLLIKYAINKALHEKLVRSLLFKAYNLSNIPAWKTERLKGNPYNER